MCERVHNVHGAAMHDLLPCWAEHKTTMERQCDAAERQLRTSLQQMANTTTNHASFDLLCL